MIKSPKSSTKNHSNELKISDQIQSQQQQCFKFTPQEIVEQQQKFETKQKYLKKKPISLIRRLFLETPICLSHVHNVFNVKIDVNQMICINEYALKEQNYEESFFKSMFYIKTVEKVELRKHAIVVDLKNIQNNNYHIQYIIERFKSFGDQKFYNLANKLETLGLILSQKPILYSKAQEPLSRYIESMQNEIYMCRVNSNKLIISRKLLELLGYDSELFAIEMCKYRTSLREIISTSRYSEVITKSLDNIVQIIQYLQNRISHQQFQQSTLHEFSDYLCTKNNKKIYCNFVLKMANPNIACFKITEILSETEDIEEIKKLNLKKKKLIKEECEQIRYKQAETLKNIISMSKSLLISNKQKIAGYRIVQIEN